MNEQRRAKFQRFMARFVTVVSGVSILLAFFVVIPASLWFTRAHPTTSLDSIFVTLFCVAFGWVFLSLSQCYTSLRRLPLDGEGRMRLFSGPRPDDPDELRAWRWGWHFVFAIIAALLCIIAIPAASWLSGR